MLSKQEKMKVTAMRVKGKDYTAIADELSLSINAVRGYCYRNGLNDYKNFSQCVYCGRSIEQKHRGGKKIFCDNKCRAKWRRKAGIFVDPVYQHICKGCGKEFETNLIPTIIEKIEKEKENFKAKMRLNKEVK